MRAKTKIIALLEGRLTPSERALNIFYNVLRTWFRETFPLDQLRELPEGQKRSPACQEVWALYGPDGSCPTPEKVEAIRALHGNLSGLLGTPEAIAPVLVWLSDFFGGTQSAGLLFDVAKYDTGPELVSFPVADRDLRKRLGRDKDPYDLWSSSEDEEEDVVPVPLCYQLSPGQVLDVINQKGAEVAAYDLAMAFNTRDTHFLLESQTPAIPDVGANPSENPSVEKTEVIRLEGLNQALRTLVTLFRDSDTDAFSSLLSSASQDVVTAFCDTNRLEKMAISEAFLPLIGNGYRVNFDRFPWDDAQAVMVVHRLCFTDQKVSLEECETYKGALSSLGLTVLPHKIELSEGQVAPTGWLLRMCALMKELKEWHDLVLDTCNLDSAARGYFETGRDRLVEGLYDDFFLTSETGATRILTAQSVNEGTYGIAMEAKIGSAEKVFADVLNRLVIFGRQNSRAHAFVSAPPSLKGVPLSLRERLYRIVAFQNVGFPSGLNLSNVLYNLDVYAEVGFSAENEVFKDRDAWLDAIAFLRANGVQSFSSFMGKQSPLDIVSSVQWSRGDSAQKSRWLQQVMALANSTPEEQIPILEQVLAWPEGHTPLEKANALLAMMKGWFTCRSLITMRTLPGLKALFLQVREALAPQERAGVDQKAAALFLSKDVLTQFAEDVKAGTVSRLSAWDDCLTKLFGKTHDMKVLKSVLLKQDPQLNVYIKALQEYLPNWGALLIAAQSTVYYEAKQVDQYLDFLTAVSDGSQARKDIVKYYEAQGKGAIPFCSKLCESDTPLWATRLMITGIPKDKKSQVSAAVLSNQLNTFLDCHEKGIQPDLSLILKIVRHDKESVEKMLRAKVSGDMYQAVFNRLYPVEEAVRYERVATSMQSFSEQPTLDGRKNWKACLVVAIDQLEADKDGHYNEALMDTLFQDKAARKIALQVYPLKAHISREEIYDRMNLYLACLTKRASAALFKNEKTRELCEKYEWSLEDGLVTGRLKEVAAFSHQFKWYVKHEADIPDEFMAAFESIQPRELGEALLEDRFMKRLGGFVTTDGRCHMVQQKALCVVVRAVAHMNEHDKYRTLCKKVGELVYTCVSHVENPAQWLNALVTESKASNNIWADVLKSKQGNVVRRLAATQESYDALEQLGLMPSLSHQAG